MKDRTLILTADQDTWPKDNKELVLFLGAWCKRYSQKNVWQQLDFKVAKYHWDDRQKLINDYEYLQSLYEKILFDLANKLNQVNSTNYSLRYWRIVVGPWLGSFIQILFDRWYMLKHVIDKEKISKCYIIQRDPMSVISNDMDHFIDLFTDDDWNEAIYGQLLQLNWGDTVNIKKIKKKTLTKKIKNNRSLSLVDIFKKNIKKYLILLFNRLLPKDNGYFFISTYLPLKELLKLQISLGQFPKFWISPAVPTKKPNIQQRQWWFSNSVLKDCSFETILRQLIPLHIPTAYIEGFKDIERLTCIINWPKNPTAIFTSVDYYSNDVFKIWSAKKTQLGTMLVIGQHGGHFGMTPFSFHENHQIEIADKWLSWGWSDKKRPKIIPIGNFKNFGKKFEYDPKGGALMVLMSIPRYSYYLYAAPISGQLLDYQEDQQKFLKNLPLELRQQVLIRLNSIDYGWDQRNYWEDSVVKPQIDFGRQNIKKLIKQCRICISTYNSTTLLDSLMLNVPTIIFWNPKNWELKEEAKLYFNLLKSVGIFHDTPEGAAQQMINIWNNIDYWWRSKEVQDARKKFCNQYSKDIDKSGELLVKLF